MSYFELRQERNLSETINIPFQFLREELGRFGKILLLIVGPAALLPAR